MRRAREVPRRAAFRQALERRLQERAAGDGARLARDRKRVAFDRLLARLTAVAPDRWLLKGGFAIDLRLGERVRSTRDVDIDWHAADHKLADALIDAVAHDPGDFFTFGIERAGSPEDRLGGSHRFRVRATLAGRPFEAFPLDVGIRVEPIAGAEDLTTPALLDFAGIAPVRVRALPLEDQAAEKLHAYTRTYLGGRTSSRVKDLVDLVVITELGGLRATALRAAIDEVRPPRHPRGTRSPSPAPGRLAGAISPARDRGRRPAGPRGRARPRGADAGSRPRRFGHRGPLGCRELRLD